MINGSLTVYEYIEDFDNPDLYYDLRVTRLMEAVSMFNDEYGTSHKPETIVYQYLKQKHFGDI